MTVASKMIGVGSLLPATNDKFISHASMQGIGYLRALLSKYTMPDADNILQTALMAGVGELESTRIPQHHKTKLETDFFVSTASMQSSGTLNLIVLRHEIETNKIDINASMTGAGELK